MSVEKLTPDERKILLIFARQALESSVNNLPLRPLQLDSLPENLQESGASFVTLTNKGKLRGCIGALEPYQPLVEDVREHAVAAANQDYRFPKVQPEELPDISIEISCLTKPKRLEYQNSTDLIKKLKPGIDGVVIKDGFHRATFLPQVWKKIPDPPKFLEQLCLKMGVNANTWRNKKIEVWVYSVVEFHEG